MWKKIILSSAIKQKAGTLTYHALKKLLGLPAMHNHRSSIRWVASLDSSQESQEWCWVFWDTMVRPGSELELPHFPFLAWAILWNFKVSWQNCYLRLYQHFSVKQLLKHICQWKLFKYLGPEGKKTMEENPNYRFKQCKIFKCTVHLCTTSIQLFHGESSALTYKISCYQEHVLCRSLNIQHC